MIEEKTRLIGSRNVINYKNEANWVNSKCTELPIEKKKNGSSLSDLFSTTLKSTRESLT